MREKIAGILCFCLILTGLWGQGVAAEPVSLEEGLFISEASWYEGKKDAGTQKFIDTPMSILTAGKRYDRITARLEIEKTGACDLDSVELIGVVQSGTMLLDCVRAVKPLNGEKGAELVFHDLTPDSGQYRIKLFVWSSMSDITPVSGIQAIEPPTQEMLADMRLIRERIAQDSGLYSAVYNPKSLLDRLRDKNGNLTGRFSGIDYTSREQNGWPVSQALANAANMMKAYYTEGNPWYHNAELKTAIDLVLQDWADHAYSSTNWWYQQIDVPKKLATILLYPLEDEPYVEKLRSLALLGMPTVDEGMPHLTGDDGKGTGANLTDKLIIAVQLAAAANDPNAMRSVVTRLLDNELSVFDWANKGEGIMIDGSLHQHGPLFYNGSYGSVFCTDVNQLLRYLKDTVFMVSDRALNTYADFILDGQSLLFKNGMSDFAPFGRAISRSDGVGGSVKGNCLGAVNILTQLPGVQRKAELNALKANRLGGTDSGANLAKHYWTSDFTLLHRPGFYISVRNSSNRNKNTEYMNDENSKAYYIADGTTVVMQSGNEYKDIFPVWDWSLIPGTTTAYLEADAIPTPAAEWGSKPFVGGVTNGSYAVAAMDYSHNQVTAKKANFLFNSGFTALGAGITGTSEREVNTTLNQCILNGTVSYAAAERVNTLSGGNRTSVTDPQWVLHDGVGYLIQSPAAAVVSSESRSGSWSLINKKGDTGSLSKNLFTLYLEHGSRPSGESYEYTVLPGVTESGLAAYAQAPDMVSVSNTEQVQAVWSKSARSAGIVFWTEGVPSYRESVTFPQAVTGLASDLTVTAAKDPCLVLLTKTAEGWELAVSNPKADTLASTRIELRWGPDGGTPAKSVTVPFPMGQERGKSVVIPLEEF